MRLDHIAYRVHDRAAAAKFLCDAFGYRIDEEFTIYFDSEKKDYAECYALSPIERHGFKDVQNTIRHEQYYLQYHMAPEVFISQGTPGSIVYNWVGKHGPGIHHIAYEVEDVAAKMDYWRRMGYAEFTTDKPIESNDLIQCFTTPHILTGTVYEFIKRKAGRGFDANNVKRLMESTITSDFPRGAP